MARVSIIIPCYNAAPWLAETLESALGQTHPDKEIIVIDDGSRDESVAIARTFEHRGIRLEVQPNRGAAAARNHGLRLATGDFIQFLDADDLLAPNKIETQIGLIGDAADVVAICRWGRFRNSVGEAVFADDDLATDFDPIDFLLLHTRNARMMHPAAWLLPRSLAAKAGLWDEQLSLNDDGEYFCRVVLGSRRILASQSTTTYYRSGLSTSLSRRRSPQALESLARSIESVATNLLRVENSPRVRAALAEYWQRLEYEVYPQNPTICRRARDEARALGGARLHPASGAKERWLAKAIGWRMARRVKLLFMRAP